MRLIDADALIGKTIEEKRFVFHLYDALRDEYVIRTVYGDLFDFINSAPIIRAEPVRHGKWLPTYHTYYNRDGSCQIADEWHCSECECFSADRRNYCPNCGAKMDGGEKG